MSKFIERFRAIGTVHTQSQLGKNMTHYTGCQDKHTSTEIIDPEGCVARIYCNDGCFDIEVDL
jgi:hypothetical protein